MTVQTHWYQCDDCEWNAGAGWRADDHEATHDHHVSRTNLEANDA